MLWYKDKKKPNWQRVFEYAAAIFAIIVIIITVGYGWQKLRQSIQAGVSCTPIELYIPQGIVVTTSRLEI